jgi:hypothetical protein
LGSLILLEISSMSSDLVSVVDISLSRTREPC